MSRQKKDQINNPIMPENIKDFPDSIEDYIKLRTIYNKLARKLKREPVAKLSENMRRIRQDYISRYPAFEETNHIDMSPTEYNILYSLCYQGVFCISLFYKQ